jgi:hypothetical protein
MTADAEATARAWVAYWEEEERTGQFPDSDVGSFVFNLDRDTAWVVILKILGMIDADPKRPLFQVLAASSTEDFLGEHGPAVIDRVEAEALRNPRFKLLLGGVWKGRMSDEIWKRVEQSRERSW